jgi:hypothetical protein
MLDNLSNPTYQIHPSSNEASPDATLTALDLDLPISQVVETIYYRPHDHHDHCRAQIRLLVLVL